MVYEGRKFGLSLLTAHQNYTQLAPELREAMASMTNFSCFRLSVKDARDAAVKFDNPAFMSKLCNLDNFNAITTLSIEGRQTTPFTLMVSKPKKTRESAETVKYIEDNSYSILVEPYKGLKPLTTSDILAHFKTIYSTGRIPRFPFYSKEQSSSNRNVRDADSNSRSSSSSVKLGGSGDLDTSKTDWSSNHTLPKRSSLLDEWLDKQNKDSKYRRKVS